MGQKIHPEGFRVGYIHDWKATWFNKRHFADYLLEDLAIRDHIENKLAHAGLSDIKITKQRGEIEVDIHTARPGIVIGKSGSEVDALRRELHRITGKPVKVNIREIKRPELDAKLVAQSIAEQLQNRVAFRRAMKRALTSAMRSGAKGVKVQVSGRLGGSEMARTEGYSDGRVPLHTLRADIDYGFTEARTTTGRIGVKCWINNGEVMPEGFRSATADEEDGLGPRPGRKRRGDGGGPGQGRPQRPRPSAPAAKPQQAKPEQQAKAQQAKPEKQAKAQQAKAQQAKPEPTPGPPKPRPTPDHPQAISGETTEADEETPTADTPGSEAETKQGPDTPGSEAETKQGPDTPGSEAEEVSG